MRVFKALAVSHTMALAFFPVLFVLLVKPFIDNPALEIGPFMFTCAQDGPVALCGWAWAWEPWLEWLRGLVGR